MSYAMNKDTCWITVLYCILMVYSMYCILILYILLFEFVLINIDILNNFTGNDLILHQSKSSHRQRNIFLMIRFTEVLICLSYYNSQLFIKSPLPRRLFSVQFVLKKKNTGSIFMKVGRKVKYGPRKNKFNCGANLHR